VGLVAKVDAGFEQLSQSELWKSHRYLSFSGLTSGGEKSRVAQPVDARGCLPPVAATPPVDFVCAA
jgi:hypothetical protein